MNGPNKLSLFRICLVPLLVAVYTLPWPQMGMDVASFSFGGTSLSGVDIACFLIFVIASFTDFLDGFIARKYNLVTSFGKFIDPIADKLLVNTSFILLAMSGRAPLAAVLLMIWRDTMVDAMRMMASSKGVVMAAGTLGKVKTVAQMVAIVLCFLNNVGFSALGIPVDIIFVWGACIVSIWSGVSYFIQAKSVLLESV